MIAGMLTDTALVLAGAAAVILTIAVLILVFRGRFRSASFDMPGLKAKVEAMDRKVDQINTAVNHQPIGAATLVQRVQQIEQHMRETSAWQTEVMVLLGKQLGVDIPPPPHQREDPSHDLVA
jgi:tetrahydromethanopterin S-methyltransferase subunit G